MATPGRDTGDRAGTVLALGPCASLLTRPDVPLRTRATKAFHWAELNDRTAPWAFLLSRTAMRLPDWIATSMHSPDPYDRELLIYLRPEPSTTSLTMIYPLSTSTLRFL